MTELTTTFKALADPTRRRVLELLQDGEQSAGALAGRFDITKPSMSHHLKLLREAGLVSSRREGQHILYRLETTVMQEAMRWLLSLRGEGTDMPPEGRAGEEGADGE